MRRLSPVWQWGIAVPTGLLFVAIGLSKLHSPSATHWAERLLRWGYPNGFSYFVGAAEALAGVALLVPVTRRSAAALVIILMTGAFGTHLLHGEYARAVPPFVLAFLCALLAFAKQGDHLSGSVPADHP